MFYCVHRQVPVNGTGDPTEGNSSSRVRDQEALATLGQRALESDDIDALMVDVNEAVADTLDTECASVFELLPGGSEFFLRQGTGWEEGVVGNTTVPTGHSQSGYTLVSKEPVIVDDLRTEDRFPGDDLLVDHGVVSGITVPIGPVENPGASSERSRPTSGRSLKPTRTSSRASPTSSSPPSKRNAPRANCRRSTAGYRTRSSRSTTSGGSPTSTNAPTRSSTRRDGS